MIEHSVTDMQKSLAIAVVGMDERARYMLDKFFKEICHGRYTITEAQLAEICIIDLDSLGAFEQFRVYRHKYPLQPVIIESLNIPEPSPQDAIFVKKPVRFTQLRAALQLAEKWLIEKKNRPADGRPPTPIPENPASVVDAVPPSLSPLPGLRDIGGSSPSSLSPLPGLRSIGASCTSPAKPEQAQHTVRNAQQAHLETNIPVLDHVVAETESASPAREKTQALGAAAYKKEILSAEQDTEGLLYFKNRLETHTGTLSYYRPELYYQSYLQKAFLHAKAGGSKIGVRPLDALLLVFTPEGEVEIYGEKAAEYGVLLIQSVSADVLKASMVFEKNAAGTQPAEIRMDAKQLLWEITLKTSKGRIPHGVELQRLFRLRQWPNLTRVASIPNAVRIAAHWTQGPVSLQSTLSELRIKKEFIYAFYSCALATELIDFDLRYDYPPKKPQHTVSKSLLRRLINRFKKADIA